MVCSWAGIREGMHDAGVHGEDGGIGAPEGAQNCGFRGVGGAGFGFSQLVEGDFVYERFETEDVTDELSFIPCRS